MKYRIIYILLSISTAWILVGCSDQEILTSYEEVKETVAPVPLSFSPYISTNVNSEATTRADLNYLNNIILDSPTDGLNSFQTFPWFNESAAIGKSWNDDSIIGYRAGQKTVSGQTRPHFRFGNFINNSYIVGLYGYHGMDGEEQMNWSTMTSEEKVSSLSSNFMTNQPLLHTASGDNWNYTPLRYWPNSTSNSASNTAKVTFISYYPFQDFEERGIGIDDNGKITGNGYYRNGRDLDGDGNPDLPDLRCITPPAKDAKGKDAYTFTFKQNQEIENHVDFLLGIDTDITKQGVNGSGIDLHLKHALCGVMFDFRSQGVTADGVTITIKINSVSLDGLYGKGKVYPTSSGVVWEELEEGNTTYTFDINKNASDIFDGYIDKMLFNNTRIRYKRQLIYQNLKNSSEGIIDEKNITGHEYVANARGMKYLMMVIPQKVNDRDAFLVVDYDITYNYGDHAIVYKNTKERIKLKDEKKQKNEGDQSQLFIAGKIIAFNIIFDGPEAITMDAEVNEWPTDEELEVEGEIDD